MYRTLLNVSYKYADFMREINNSPVAYVRAARMIQQLSTGVPGYADDISWPSIIVAAETTLVRSVYSGTDPWLASIATEVETTVKNTGSEEYNDAFEAHVTGYAAGAAAETLVVLPAAIAVGVQLAVGAGVGVMLYGARSIEAFSFARQQGVSATQAMQFLGVYFRATHSESFALSRWADSEAGWTAMADLVRFADKDTSLDFHGPSLT
jgi:hypothetical protein